MAHQIGQIGEAIGGMMQYGSMITQGIQDSWSSSSGGGGLSGSLDWDQIYGASTSEMGDYLEEFDLDSDYLKYITPLNVEPFILEYQKYSLGRDTLMGKTGGSLVDLQSDADKLRGQTGFASSGQVDKLQSNQEESLVGGYQTQLSGLGIESMQRVTAEKDRQVERFYDDIGNILTYDAQKNQSGGDSDTNIYCFSPDSKVELKSGLKIPMKYVKKGDIVKSDLNGNYSEIISWLHKDKDNDVNLIEIENEDGKIVTLSESHVLFKNKTNTKELFAGDINVGDKIQGKKIISIKTIVYKGFYAPITLSGKIVVDDYYCSCFAVVTHAFSMKVWNFMTTIRLHYLVDRFPRLFEQCIGPHALFFFPWLAFNLSVPFAKTYQNSGKIFKFQRKGI